MEKVKTINEIMGELDVRPVQVEKPNNPLFVVAVEGETTSGETLYTESAWEMKFPSAVQTARHIIYMIEKYREEILNWNPQLMQEAEYAGMPMEPTTWQEDFIEYGLIPETEEETDSGEYCSKITDIQMYLSDNGLQLPIIPDQLVRTTPVSIYVSELVAEIRNGLAKGLYAVTVYDQRTKEKLDTVIITNISDTGRMEGNSQETQRRVIYQLSDSSKLFLGHIPTATEDQGKGQLYRIPFAYQKYGYLQVRAESLEKAVRKAETKLETMSLIEMEDCSGYLQDSAEIDTDGIVLDGKGNKIEK